MAADGAPPPEINSAYDTLVEQAFSALWSLQPGEAVYLGRHEYDAIVPDWSEPAVALRLADLRRIAEELVGLESLSRTQDIDRTILLYRIHEEVFRWERLREPLRDPMRWVYELDPDLYMKRSYAPLVDRAAVVNRLLEQVGPFLATARGRLDAVLARTICTWGMTAATGLAEMIVADVPVAFAQLRDDGEHAAVYETLSATATGAAQALTEFARWLEEERLPVADDSFAIGRENLEEMLRLSEVVEMPVPDLLEVAEADLEHNLAAFRETAAEIDPDLAPHEVYDRYVADRHAEHGGLVAAAETMLEEIRDYLIEKDLVTIPSDVRAKVAPTPQHMRWASR